jgi:hypothetical protein
MLPFLKKKSEASAAPLVLARAAAAQVFGQVTVGVDPAKPVVKASDVVVRVR